MNLEDDPGLGRSGQRWPTDDQLEPQVRQGYSAYAARDLVGGQGGRNRTSKFMAAGQPASAADEAATGLTSTGWSPRGWPVVAPTAQATLSASMGQR